MSDRYLESRSVGTLLRRRKERGSNDDPLLSVTQDKGVTLQEGVGRRNISSADKASYWRAYAGDIVYNTMRMWQGASACSRYFGIVSPAYTVCEPVDGANADYISYLFKLPENIGKFRSRSQGIVSDVWNLRFSELKRIAVDTIPDREHQLQIAAILSTIDTAIEQADAFVAKVQQIKAGMMQDLFTRGVQPNGELRPPHEEAPQLYKESPLGWIPKEWGTAAIGESFEIQLGKMLSKETKTGKCSAPYAGNRAVQWGRVDTSQLEEMDFFPNERTKFRLAPGDLLVCEGGEVGRTAMWHGEIDECYYQKAIEAVRQPAAGEPAAGA